MVILVFNKQYVRLSDKIWRQYKPTDEQDITNKTNIRDMFSFSIHPLGQNEEDKNMKRKTSSKPWTIHSNSAVGLLLLYIYAWLHSWEVWIMRAIMNLKQGRYKGKEKCKNKCLRKCTAITCIIHAWKLQNGEKFGEKKWFIWSIHPI